MLNNNDTDTDMMVVSLQCKDSVPYMTIRDIVIWIEADLARPMPVITIAEKAGYSPWYLQRLFKQITGHTLVGFIRGRRMTVAAELLESSQCSITDIYTSIGFEEHSSFCRNFMRHFGITPTIFRANPGYYSSKKLLPPEL